MVEDYFNDTEAILWLSNARGLALKDVHNIEQYQTTTSQTR